jgi:hypothetical protein
LCARFSSLWPLLPRAVLPCLRACVAFVSTVLFCFGFTNQQFNQPSTNQPTNQPTNQVMPLLKPVAVWRGDVVEVESLIERQKENQRMLVAHFQLSVTPGPTQEDIGGECVPY